MLDFSVCMEQPVYGFVIKNRQIIRPIRRQVFGAFQDNVICGLFLVATQIIGGVRTHVYILKLNCPKPVRKRVTLTHVDRCLRLREASDAPIISLINSNLFQYRALGANDGKKESSSSHHLREWRTQKTFMGAFIQWRMVSFVFGVRCLWRHNLTSYLCFPNQCFGLVCADQP